MTPHKILDNRADDYSYKSEIDETDGLRVDALKLENLAASGTITQEVLHTEELKQETNPIQENQNTNKIEDQTVKPPIPYTEKHDHYIHYQLVAIDKYYDAYIKLKTQNILFMGISTVLFIVLFIIVLLK